MMIIENKFNIGGIVYLKTDADRSERIVVAIQVTAYTALYKVACGFTETLHYDFELSYEKNFVLKNNKEDKDE